jgi:hypothetical protein
MFMLFENINKRRHAKMPGTAAIQHSFAFEDLSSSLIIKALVFLYAAILTEFEAWSRKGNWWFRCSPVA